MHLLKHFGTSHQPYPTTVDSPETLRDTLYKTLRIEEQAKYNPSANPSAKAAFDAAFREGLANRFAPSTTREPSPIVRQLEALQSVHTLSVLSMVQQSEAMQQALGIQTTQQTTQIMHQLMHDGPTKQRLAQVNQRMQEIEDVVKQVNVNGKTVYKKAYDRRLHDGVEALHIDVLRPFDWFFGKRIEHPNLLQGLPDKYYSSRDKRDAKQDLYTLIRQANRKDTFILDEMQQIEAQPEVLMLYMVTINRMRNNLPMTGDALEQFALDPNVSDATREQFLASFHHKRPRLEMVFDETRPTFDWPTAMFDISTRVLLNSAKSAPTPTTPTSPKPFKPPTPLGTPLQPSDRAALTKAFGGKVTLR